MAVETAPVPETVEGLRRQNGALRTLNHSLEQQIAHHREKAHAYHLAITALDSEREMNAVLTDENERLRAEVAEIKAALADPQAVHLNMLRGGIATPALRSLLHLYGQDALATYDRGAAA